VAHIRAPKIVKFVLEQYWRKKVRGDCRAPPLNRVFSRAAAGSRATGLLDDVRGEQQSCGLSASCLFFRKFGRTSGINVFCNKEPVQRRRKARIDSHLHQDFGDFLLGEPHI
jgi:hypothetical protein